MVWVDLVMIFMFIGNEKILMIWMQNPLYDNIVYSLLGQLIYNPSLPLNPGTPLNIKTIFPGLGIIIIKIKLSGPYSDKHAVMFPEVWKSIPMNTKTSWNSTSCNVRLWTSQQTAVKRQTRYI